MAAIPRLPILLFLAIATLAEVARAGSGDEPAPTPADRADLALARSLLHRAKRRLDEQHRARPTAGSRYTDGVAAALAEVGDRDAAEATSRLRQGFGSADAALGALAVGYARGGDMPRVRQTILRIQDAGTAEARQKPRAWLRAGQALAESGRDEWAAEAFAEAIRSEPKAPAGSPPSVVVDASFLIEIAEGQRRIGRVDESRATLDLAVRRAIADKTMSSIDLRKVSAAQARLGFLPEALATVDRFDEPKDRWWAYHGIVEAEAEAGRLDDAIRVAERVEGDAITKTWLAIAAAQAKAGHPDEARRSLERAEAEVRRIDQAGRKIQMILLLAESRGTLGDKAAAHDWLRQATELAQGSVVLQGGVARQIERVPGAVALRSHLCWIADVQAKLGDAEAARRSFERAKVAAEDQQPGLWRDGAVRSIAGAQARAGLTDDALRTLATLPKAENDWYFHAPVAEAKARAGDLDGAGRVMALHPGDATETRFSIAQGLMAAGNAKDALRVGLEAGVVAEELLHDAARKLAASGDVAVVTDAVARAYYEFRVALLLGAAEGLLDRVDGRRREAGRR